MTDITLFILPIAFLCSGVILITYIFCCSWYHKREYRPNFRCCVCISPKNDDPFDKEDDLPRYEELSVHIGEDLEDNPPTYEEAMQNMFVPSILHSFQEQVNAVFQNLTIHIKGTPTVITRCHQMI